MTAPAITPATGVPKKAADSIPPIGSRGLPFTWTFRDWPSDVKPVNQVAFGASNNKILSETSQRVALFDENLWTERQMNAAGVSGVSIQKEPLSPTTGQYDSAYVFTNPILSPDANAAKTIAPRTRHSVNQCPPTLHHGRGSLIFSTTNLGVSVSIHDATKLKSSAQFQGLSFSNCGRFVDHPEENYSSARPANHSWHKANEGFQPLNNMTQIPNSLPLMNKETDHAIGGLGANLASNKLSTDPMYLGADLITSTVVRTVSAIPSNGLGSIYGDSHNSLHYTNVVCSNLDAGVGAGETAISQANGGVDPVASFEYSKQTHWCLNIGTTQNALLNGVEVSAPDGLSPASTWNPISFDPLLWDTNSASAEMSKQPMNRAYTSKTETIQQIMTSDAYSIGSGAPQVKTITTLGDIALGASVVHDTAGLIGFEGTITATAFYAPTKDTDPTQTQAPINNSSNKNHGYAGLNIQVHSGLTMRRNKGMVSKYGAPYRYGSDGSPVRVMTDAMKTTAMRGDGSTSLADANANQTWFRTGTPAQNNATVPSTDPNGIPAIGDVSMRTPAIGGTTGYDSNNPAPPDMFGGGQTATIIGANMPASKMNNEIHNSYSTGRWIADGVPTKVQIIPVITGYEDVQVSAGAAKVAAGHSGASMTFRKPLVDYHILVSITEPQATSASTAHGVQLDGDPTQRNTPMGNRLSANADYSKQGCVIYHGIFRIDPETLEQIFIDAADPASGIYNMTNQSCPRSVMPRHTNNADGTMRMGWGLHQATPFRPIALTDKFGKVPRLCGAIEGGGFYQRGGISHLWDGCEYGGEVFVGADCIKPHELQTSDANGTNEFGRTNFGLLGNGQIWADGTGAPKRTTGMELFIWRYSPQDDPLYPQTHQQSKIAMGIFTNGLNKHGQPYAQATMDNITPSKMPFEKPREGGLNGAVWALHDWVMPQVELMRYLGREEKTEAEHFEVSGSQTFHPSLHCSSLRAMEDGRFMMAAVHVDYIKTEADYPTNEIRYPLNPDLDVATCPVGYYFSGGKCIPLVGSSDLPSGQVADPQSGDAVPSPNDSHPAPVNGTGSSTPNKQDNFSLHPTWSKLKANTQARSLIMMFSDVKADASTGRATRGKALWEVKYNKIGLGDGTTQTIITQNWNYADTWWSGSRISYWYQESGQRAIPITYGSYPDCRMSYANLPRSLPFLVNEFPDPSQPTSTQATIKSGFPFIQPATIAKNLQTANSELFQNYGIDTNIMTWTLLREKHLKLTRFVPTTIGFADFGAGANPYQELGYSGWSFPRGLYDPMGYGDNSVFFSDAPESENVSMATAITPTQQAIFAGMGQTDFDNDTPAAQAESLLGASFGYSLDLSGLTFPAQFESAIIFKTGTGQEKLIGAPHTVGNLAEIVAILLNPATSNYSAIDQEYVNTGEPALAVASGFTGIQRTFNLSNMTPNETARIMEFSHLTFDGVQYPFVRHAAKGSRMLRGGLGGWSHHGGLHYGISTKLHPYRIDRVMKQVHGGVGYDLPLHLLKPAKAHVRARAGGTNSIDLELETPFHRTDNIHLLGATNFNTGFNLGGQSPPNQPRPVMGQYYLRSNLWDKPTYGSAGVSGGLISPIDELNQRIHGPIISGSQALEAFWSDHPTDHFHASAMPILPRTDYDLAMIENSNYAPIMFAQATEINDLDVLALGEQLESSVDVHVSKTAKPYWDSGSIVSAQGEGYRGNKANHMIQTSAMMDGLSINQGGTLPTQYANGSHDMSMGMGQRGLRTPDGTLHQFHIRRSAQAGSNNLPQWTHYKKPLWGCVFWNSKAMKPQPDQAVHSGLDECGPLLNSIGASGDGTSASLGKVMGAAYCSDSNGTIHAVLEYHASDGAGHKAHRLYYHRADRKLVNYNPDPVYDWDWSVHTPVLIQNNSIIGSAGGSMYDLRQPSIVCDSSDRLHLVCVQIITDSTGGLPQMSRILYSSKLPEETSFPEFAPNASGDVGMPDSKRWQRVHDIITDAGQTSLNSETGTSHLTTNNQEPKVCLRGDDIPVVFYRGKPIESFSTSNRLHDAIYCNIGKSPSGSNDPSGVFVFDPSKPIHVVGLRPDSKNTISDFDVQYYDAIVDERDIAYVVSTKDDYDSTDTHAPRQTLLTFFDTQKALADQYTTTDGLGTHLTIWEGRDYTTSGDAKQDNNYRDLTLTTNGKGELHLIMTFCMIGDNPERFGETFRDATQPQARQSAIAPLQWAATPSGDLTGVSEVPYIGGFVKPAVSPNWTGQVVPPMPPYKATNPNRREHNHIMHIWIPSIEFDDSGSNPRVLRSMNIRWLSVPSVKFDTTTQSWIPVGSAQTMAGEEDFPHHSPQIRYQRFWGFDASELDLRWHTNELAWYRTNKEGSDVYYPSAGGVQMQIGTGQESGQGIAGFPNGV